MCGLTGAVSESVWHGLCITTITGVVSESVWHGLCITTIIIAIAILYSLRCTLWKSGAVIWNICPLFFSCQNSTSTLYFHGTKVKTTLVSYLVRLHFGSCQNLHLQGVSEELRFTNLGSK